jgi:cytochrome c oxidase accessory protein FixG
MKKDSDVKLDSELFRERLSTIDDSGKRKWLFPKRPHGGYYTKRSIVSWIYFIIFFTLPFIKYQGKPLFQFNFIKGEYIILGNIFWPQDFLILGLIFLAALLFIALFTMVFGRFFCGWVCPQTVFLEMLFRKIDYWIMGDGAQQKYLHQQPWNKQKIGKYILRYFIYLVLSFAIANVFLSYIISIDELFKIITEPVFEHLGGFISIVVFTLVFFSVFAFLREQVCTNICPYGRLQGVLLDKNTIAVVYDHRRGEPRAKYNKAKLEEGSVGSCIDCKQCIQVCPTGIDIRNGIQLECTNCTACIDACNEIMDKIGQPKGLIRYDSEANVAGGKPFKFTPRIKVYSVVLLGILITVISMLINRAQVGVKLMRSAGLTYQERGTDSLTNLYTVKLENKTNDTLYLTFRLIKPNGVIEMVGQEEILLLPAGRASTSFFVVLDKKDITARKNEIEIDMYQNNVRTQSLSTNFLAPLK